MARTPTTLMAALGLAPQVERLYNRVLRDSGRELSSVADVLAVSTETLIRDLGPLLEHGIVRIEQSRLFVETPAETISRRVSETAASAAAAQGRLSEIAAALPFLTVDGPDRPGSGGAQDVTPLDGEVSTGTHLPRLIADLIRRSPGDLCWLRPDQFRASSEDGITELISDVVASGRRSRAIYPVRALTEVPELLAARSELGEELRVLPQLPTRMLIVGTSYVVLPEPLGYYDEPRTLTRQRGLVEAMTFWFDLMWSRAVPVPDLDRDDVRPDLRHFLLQQLAAGAQDEQIARRLGVSLRTVRRRVSEMMAELGAESRFQAGVEAVRRGWL